METPGEEVGYDAVNLRRARLLYAGETDLPQLPPKAFKLTRRASRGQGPRVGRPRIYRGVSENYAPRLNPLVGFRVAVAVAQAPVANAEVRVHELADIGLGERVVTAQRVLDAGRGQHLAAC